MLIPELLPTANDLASGLQGAAGMLRNLRIIVSGGMDVLDTHKEKRAARHLAALAFMPSGTLQPLGRIARGVATKNDFMAIHKMLEESTEVVAEAMAILGRYEDFVREHFGMEARCA